MQKISNRLYLLFVLMSFVFGIFGLTSCSEGNKTSLKLSFEQNEYQLEVGEQIEVEPIFKNAGEEPLYLVWKSYNTSVVSVNDGVLEGVGVGKTEVKVFISGNTNVYATLTVKVTSKNQMPVAKFNEVPATLYVGDELQLTYELANAENECEFVYQSLTDAATVDQNGLIKVLEDGYALVTVKVTDKVTGQYVNYNFSFEVLTNYDITYVLDEGINNEENPSFYIANQKDVVLQNPEKYGYNFLGWYEDEEFTKPISVIDVDRKENITLYAQWDAIKYSIEYNENEGKMPTYNVPSEYQYGTTTELPRPRLAGYKFAGWYENENFDGEALFEINDKVTGNKVLYAKYVESVAIVADEFDTSKVYKLGVHQGNTNKTLYATGVLSGYYGASTQKPVEAADVKVVEVDGGYNLKVILANGKIYYANLVVSGTYVNLKFENNPTSVWTYNSQYNTFVTIANSTTYFLGTYGTYETFSPSKESFFTSNFISHLYEEVELTDELEAKLTLEQVEVDEELTENYTLPTYNNVIWELLDGKGAAELSNGIMLVTRPAEGEGNVEITLTAKYEIDGNVIASKDFLITILANVPASEELVLHASYDFGTAQNTGYANQKSWTIKEGVSNKNTTVIGHQSQITTSSNSPHSSHGAFGVICPTRKNNSTKQAYIQFSFSEVVKQITFEVTWWSSSDKSSHASKITKFEVQYSSDGTTWTSVDLGAVSNIDATKYTEITVDLVNAKYVRILAEAKTTYSSNQNARIVVDNVKIFK